MDGKIFHFSVPKNKRRRKNDRRTQGRRGEYYEEASPAPSSSTHPHARDARYNDMAPK